MFKNLWRCAVLQGRWPKILLLQEIFVTSVVDLKLKSECCHMYRSKTLCLEGDSSNAFPRKCFVQYKLYLTILLQAKIYLFIPGSNSRADCYLTFNQVPHPPT